MAENEMDPAELVEKALLVQNLRSLGTAFQSDSELQDKLIIHFQRKSNCGGDIQNVIYPLNSLKEDAIVVFTDAKDMMSAAQHKHVLRSQHEPMRISHPITVRRLPPVFASVEAKIDPFYFNIMPLGASAGFSKRIEKLANVEVDRSHAGKISCSHRSQLELIEREVCGLVMSHVKYSMLSEDGGFEAAGASNYELNSKPVHMGLGENKYREDDKMEVAEENEERRTTGLFLKQSDEPEDFLGDHSTPQLQSASTKEECDDKSQKKQSSLSVRVDETSKETDVDNVRRLKNEDNLVVLDKSTYAYLHKFEDEAFTKLTKQNLVQVKVVQGHASEELEGFIIPSSKKTSALNVSKAKDEFISFYQKLHYDIERKMVDCSSVDAPSIDKATKETIRQFKDDTLITKVNGSPHLRFILRRGNVEEVVRQFRKIAGIKSRKTLRNAGTGVQSTEDTRSDITNSMRSGADNPEVRSKDGQQNKQPSHDPQLASGSFNDNMEFTTNEGMHIAIRTGDITKQSAVAVVCPSDQFLTSGNGGVAKAILDAAGAQLGDHCRKIMRGRNPLQMTECVITPGFMLRCNVVIHVWGPTNTLHQQQFKSDLYCSFLNCLRIAERDMVSSLAIPLMGSGSIGAPKMLCADALAFALIDFSRESGGSKYVREVFLVNIDNDSSKAIQQSLQMAFSATYHSASPYSSSATPGMGFSQSAVGDSMKPGAVSHIQPTTPISPSDERSKHGKYQAPVKTDYHGIGKAPESQHNWRKQGESQGHVKNDQHVVGEKHKSQNLKADECPTPEESEEQLKKNLKDSTVGNAADGEAYGNRTVRHDDADPADKQVRSTGDQGGPLDAKPQAQSAEVKEAECPICLADTIVDAVVLRCKHQFCKACIDQALKSSYKCPICQAVCDEPRGNQPKGTMKYIVSSYSHLSGYGKDGVITIDYCIPSGTQSADHPNPGKYFIGTNRTAYLPDNRKGREVLALLRKAFDAGLVFTVGQSITSGLRDTVTWNDIHHKTSMSGGPQSFGYPDPDYLKRVKEDLAAKGIK